MTFYRDRCTLHHSPRGNSTFAHNLLYKLYTSLTSTTASLSLSLAWPSPHKAFALNGFKVCSDNLNILNSEVVHLLFACYANLKCQKSVAFITIITWYSCNKCDIYLLIYITQIFHWHNHLHHHHWAHLHNTDNRNKYNLSHNYTK